MLKIAGERQEVHATFGRTQVEGHGGRLHVPPPHVRHLQPGEQERVQGLQDAGAELREPGRRGLVEGLLPQGRRIPGKGIGGNPERRGRGEHVCLICGCFGIQVKLETYFHVSLVLGKELLVQFRFSNLCL